MATPSLSALAAAAANAVNAARAAQREGEPFRMPIYAPLPGEQWADSHEHMQLPAVRQWSHPFGSKADPLRQLTELANAKGGYYPLGRNGYWHAGVHFDAGTAGILDQSFVRCLADGEVVAYRIDSQSPASEFTVNRLPVQRPFTRNFVLVRHRLQAPKIAGSDDAPPSLTFYSLYMHLQDWSAYQVDQSLQRPAFWPPGKTLRVKDTEHDHVPGLDGLVWLRTRIGPNGGAIISGLSRGTEVTVRGTSSYRKLENLAGPRQLLSEGPLQGYVRFGHLAHINGNEYRATHDLDVLASADAHAHRLMKLPQGTEVRISGEGAYRKLEWVNQYVHFDSLLSEPEPQERDCCVVLDEPIPIKAGALVGHLGAYHFCFAEEPTQQLHLEVFSGQNVGGFIHFCREWAKRLPASGKTWLQLPKGTPIAPDRADLSAARYPIVDTDTARSAADLYLPKSLLDGLKPEHKLAIPAKDGRKACTWYRLENLLHDEQNQLHSGWVKVEADAQWASPWEWPGYDVICNRDTPQRCVAYRQQTTMERLNEQARERYSQMADLSDQGPLRSRLFEIIDRNRDGRMTADELQKALELPAHAQSISRLVIHCENEWHWIPQKWNELDEILGHTPSTPHTNWLSGKRRIEQMCWWNDVAGKVGLPADGRVWHFHPIGMPVAFWRNLHPQIKINENSISLEFLHLNQDQSIKDSDYENAARALACEMTAIKAVAISETGSTGSYYIFEEWDAVPAILFERHYFHALTNGIYDASNPVISNAHRGGYGTYKSQYSKLLEAYALDSSAALQSASWGKFQIMGKYFRECGYESVEDFVLDIGVSEVNQLKAFVKFISSNPVLVNSIRAKNWREFALSYNGPAQEGYDEKIRQNYESLND